MFAREIRAKYLDHDIIVTNSWGAAALSALIREGVGAARKALGDETKLYVNGRIVDSTTNWILISGAPLLRTCIEKNGNNYDIEVYAKAGWFRNLIKICIDGKQIAGDEF